MNAVTFLISAGLVARIPERSLRSEESLTPGYWRDVCRRRAGSSHLGGRCAPCSSSGTSCSSGARPINVAEVVFAKDTLSAGDLGFGAIVAASGVGLALGSYLAAPALGKVGLRRHYAGSIVLMGVGWGGAALSRIRSGSPSPFVVGGAAGNGAAIICNQILVQRGAPDRSAAERSRRS